jgi:hypothetical protein
MVIFHSYVSLPEGNTEVFTAEIGVSLVKWDLHHQDIGISRRISMGMAGLYQDMVEIRSLSW